MTDLHYFKFNIGDYASHTRHLTLIEDMAYRRLLEAYYLQERPLNSGVASLARHIGMREHEAEVKQVLDEFFHVDDGYWRHSRADREIAEYHAKIDQTSSAGKASAAKRFNGRSTDVQLNTKQEPITKKQETVEIHPATQDSPQAALGDCPHGLILDLWAEVLPSMPQHEKHLWRGTRADHLRARWRETAVEKKWPDQAAGLAYLRKLFAFVGKSQFLTGRAPSNGKRTFQIELEWLVNPTNWAKVIEGKYHETQQV